MLNNNLNQPKSATKAVILARVSSKGQEDGYSLDAQLESCHKYAQSKGLTVLKEYELVESSTRGDRKKFNEMITFVAKQKECTAVIAHTVDRFQRRFNETVMCEPFIMAGTMELHFVQSGLVINADNYYNQSLVWDVNVMGARSYISAIKVHTRKGLARKIANGELPSKAPIGYKNVGNKGSRTIVVDEEVSPLVIKAFNDYATGNYSFKEITASMKKAGYISCKHVPFVEASIRRTLGNPFYYGMMTVKGELKPHIYPPLISKELFDKCQVIREKHLRKPRRKDKADFVFKHLVTCGTCNHTVSSYRRQRTNKTNGKTHEYVYLRCAGKANSEECNCKAIREDEALEVVKQELQKLQVPAQLLQGALERIVGKLGTTHQVEQLEQVSIKRRLGQIAHEKGIWVEKQVIGLLTNDVVNAKLKALALEEQELQAKLSGAKQQGITKQTAWMLARAVNLLSRLPELFESSQIAQKRKIMTLVFANLVLKEKSLYIIWKKPFSLMAEGLNRVVTDRLNGKHSTQPGLETQLCLLSDIFGLENGF